MNSILLRGVVLFIWAGVFTASAQLKLKLGVMGDSLSDEYFEDPTRAGAKNWLQQLAEFRAVEPGPTAAAAGQPQGTWGPPRGTGYAYNWSTPWATARTLLSSGQATGLAAQIAVDGIDCTVLAIGNNDFNPYADTYSGIYDSRWSQAKIRTFELSTLAKIRTALIQIRRTGVPLLLVNILDVGTTPAVVNGARYADATHRERVTAVIRDLNHRLRQLAQEFQVPVVDWFGIEESLAGSPTNLSPVLLVGNIPIQLQHADSGSVANGDLRDGYLADGFHPNTTLQGVFANAIIAGINSCSQANLAYFTEAEILEHAGLSYGGIDTLSDCLNAYTNYIIRPIPLGPTGTFQFEFSPTTRRPPPSVTGHLELKIRTKIDPRDALPRLIATAELRLPNSPPIGFSEVPVHYSTSTGYTLIFQRHKPISPAPASERRTVLIIRNLRFSGSTGNWQPHSGKLTYQHGVEQPLSVVD